MDMPRPTEAPSGKQTRTAVRHAPELLPAGKELPIRVLILEDDPDIAESLSLVLSLDESFAVEIVHDVATCLERLQASTALTALSARGHVHTFDVLLLDMLLGGGHVGTEVLGAAVAIPHLDMPPVVVCTGLSRAYLGAHWLSDAVAGILLGISCAVVTALMIGQIQRRVEGRQGTA